MKIAPARAVPVVGSEHPCSDPTRGASVAGFRGPENMWRTLARKPFSGDAEAIVRAQTDAWTPFSCKQSGHFAGYCFRLIRSLRQDEQYVALSGAANGPIIRAVGRLRAAS